MTLETLQIQAEQIRQRAERIARAQYALAQAAAYRAGVGDGRNVWSNAEIARQQGRPWPEVDYDALRQAEYHDRVRDVAYQLADRIITRLLRRYESANNRTRTTPRLSDRPIVGPIISWQRPYRDGRIDRR